MSGPKKSAKRAYRSPMRSAAREATRKQILVAAERVLEARGWDGFSVEAVARDAGVTRLTVYHQFGERSALLEAVFDAQALARGLGSIAAAMALNDPRTTLARVVRSFGDFWEASGSMRGLMAASMADPQLGEAIAARNERRRALLRVIVERFAERGELAPARVTAVVDTLFALTSFAFWNELRPRMPSDAVGETIETLALDLVRPRPSPNVRGRTDSASRVVAAQPAAAYRAFADPDALMAWLPPRSMTGRALAYDFRQGGRYRIELTYGRTARSAAGKTTAHTDVSVGRFLALQPGERIVQSVEFESADPAFAGEMVMTWAFEPIAAGTRVTVSVENVPPGISKRDHDAGLRSSLENLARYLDAGPSDD